MKHALLFLFIAALVGLLGYGLSQPNPVLWNSLEVTITAYNSTRAQTDGNPNVAAWNNRLDPNVPSVAVSRDLIPMGLGNGTKIYIKGLGGPYMVLDKMNSRFKRRVDLYFGKDVKAARQFGKTTATIYWW